MCNRHLPMVQAGFWALVFFPVTVDAAVAPGLAAELGSLLGLGVRVLVVDMTRTGACDPAGARMLLMVHHQAAAGGAELRLVVPSAGIRQVLGRLTADRLPGVFGSLGQALAESPPPAGTEADSPE